MTLFGRGLVLAGGPIIANCFVGLPNCLVGLKPPPVNCLNRAASEPPPNPVNCLTRVVVPVSWALTFPEPV